MTDEKLPKGKSIVELLDDLQEAHLRLKEFYSYSDESARDSGANLTEKQRATLMDLQDENSRKERALLVVLLPLHLESYGFGRDGDVSYAALGAFLQDVSRQMRLPA